MIASLKRGRMHYVLAGTAEPVIVLLHGWPGFGFDWRLAIEPAGSLGTVVVPDFFGFGDSDELPPGEHASEEAFAGDVLDLLDALGAAEVVLAGQDIGSAVAPAVARAAPRRVRALVLLNPTHPGIGSKRFAPSMQREAWYQHFHLLALAERLLDGKRDAVAAYLAHFYEHWAGERVIEPADLAVVVDAYARPGAFRASIAWYRSRVERHLAPTPATPVETPTVALWGDQDPMRPLDHREGFELTFPRSESRVLEGVGHFVAAEAPDEVVDAIARALEWSERRRS